jgi:hypothetical protein
MLKLKVNKMENAYGINSLRTNFGGDSLFFQVAIYSPNGIFKTSFSRTLHNLSSNNLDDIEDRITHTKAAIDLELVDDNGNIITKDLSNKVIVFSRELYMSSNDLKLNSCSNELRFLTTDKESKDQLDKIISDAISKMKISISNKIKAAKLKEDKAIEILIMKNIDDLELSDLEEIFRMVKDIEIKDISKVDNKKLFQKAYNPIDTEEFLDAANNYVSIYQKRLSEELFDGDFNDSNCMAFLDQVKDSSFLNEEKKRGLYLKDNTYYDIAKIKRIFSEAIKKISAEPRILDANRELMKSMGNSQESNALKKSFQKDPLLINQLALGRKKIILISLKNQGLEAGMFLEEIENIKKDYAKLLKEAKTKQSQFEEAIKIYKNRFNPVFDVEIKNKEESILGEKIPSIVFKHKSQENVELNEETIRNILSSGEKTALNIISFIVNYEAKKENNPIIILDDLVETFDYANRHAFIEYIRDIVAEKRTIIVLTHNYEFYRNLGRRIPELDKLSAYSKNGIVSIEKNKKLNKDIESIFNVSKDEELILSIPYLREVKTMLDMETKILDSCLHYKIDTKNISVSDLKKEYIKPIVVTSDDTKKYYDLLFSLADKINIDNHYDIDGKTILSIACRLLLESKIIGDKFELIKDIKTNQLAKLKDDNYNLLTNKTIELIDRVQISTPEFIHGNAFMYEPLIDIDGNYLLETYKDIKGLKEKDVWK